MDEWTLFGTAWLTMLLAAMVLAVPGIMVVARGQILLAIAAGQAAACGAAAAMWAIGLLEGSHLHGDPRIHIGALCGGLIGTGLAWRGSGERAAWLFALASAGTVLLVGNSPYGMHDVLALQHSNVLIANDTELIAFLILALILVPVVLRFHRALRLLAIDPDHAGRCGISRRLWESGLGWWLGIVLSLSVSTFGLLITFCWLILPTMIAARLSICLWPLMLLAPLIAVAGTVGGIVVGHAWDLPPGQSVALLLALAYPFAAICNVLRWS